MKMKDAHSGFSREFVEAWRLVRLFDQATNCRDLRRVLFDQGRTIGLAPFTRPEPRFLRLSLRCVEPNVFGPRQPCRTGRPAINTRRFDRIVEFSVGRCFASNDRSPPRIAFYQSCGLCILFRLIHIRSLSSLTPFNLARRDFADYPVLAFKFSFFIDWNSFAHSVEEKSGQSGVIAIDWPVDRTAYQRISRLCTFAMPAISLSRQ
jgi:hypothetical protein